MKFLTFFLIIPYFLFSYTLPDVSLYENVVEYTGNYWIFKDGKILFYDPDMQKNPVVYTGVYWKYKDGKTILFYDEHILEIEDSQISQLDTGNVLEIVSKKHYDKCWCTPHP